MNTPRQIRGFTTYAPDYPNIVGLHYTQFARALCNAIKERAEAVNMNLGAYVDCDFEQGTYKDYHFRVDVDTTITDLCKRYTNQYSAEYGSFWTFDTLLAKAADVLGLQSGEEIAANRGGGIRGGFSTAAWGIQRATMLSLLTHYDVSYHNNSGVVCHFYTYSRYGRVDIENLTPQRENVEDAIAASSVELDAEEYSAGRSVFRFRNFVSWESESLGGWDRYCHIEKTEQAYLVPGEGYSILLDCDAVIVANLDDDDGDRYYFDDMGDNYVVGYNYINVHIDSNGVFWNTGGPSYPSIYPDRQIGYMPIVVGYSGPHKLVALLGNKFNYQLVW